MDAVRPADARPEVTAEQVRRMRRTIVAALRADGWPVARVAELLGVDRRTIARWTRAEAEG